jgi:hypothetical protein
VVRVVNHGEFSYGGRGNLSLRGRYQGSSFLQ